MFVRELVQAHFNEAGILLRNLNGGAVVFRIERAGRAFHVPHGAGVRLSSNRFQNGTSKVTNLAIEALYVSAPDAVEGPKRAVGSEA